MALVAVQLEGLRPYFTARCGLSVKVDDGEVDGDGDQGRDGDGNRDGDSVGDDDGDVMVLVDMLSSGDG